MMGLAHETVAGIAKLVGMFCMIVLFIGVCIYVFWPGNSDRFRRAKRSILNEEDSPPDEDEPR